MLAGRSLPKKLATIFYGDFQASAALQTVVSPASNTKGIRVSYIQAKAPTHIVCISAKSSAPSGTMDSTSNVLLYVEGAVSGKFHKREDEFIIPPGLGLYAKTSNNEVGLEVHIDYEVLA